jgi:hypothetical protein
MAVAQSEQSERPAARASMRTRRRSSATTTCFDPGILDDKLNCTPYLEIRRRERTRSSSPILSTCNSDISSHKQRLRYTMPCRLIPMNDRLPVWSRSPVDRSPVESLYSAAVNTNLYSTDPNRRSSAAKNVSHSGRMRRCPRVFGCHFLEASPPC